MKDLISFGEEERPGERNMVGSVLLKPPTSWSSSKHVAQSQQVLSRVPDLSVSELLIKIRVMQLQAIGLCFNFLASPVLGIQGDSGNQLTIMLTSKGCY